MGLKGCKWSSLNAPGTETPVSYPLQHLTFTYYVSSHFFTRNASIRARWLHTANGAAAHRLNDISGANIGYVIG